jgi:hypothetical protein
MNCSIRKLLAPTKRLLNKPLARTLMRAAARWAFPPALAIWHLHPGAIASIRYSYDLAGRAPAAGIITFAVLGGIYGFPVLVIYGMWEFRRMAR